MQATTPTRSHKRRAQGAPHHSPQVPAAASARRALPAVGNVSSPAGTLPSLYQSSPSARRPPPSELPSAGAHTPPAAQSHLRATTPRCPLPDNLRSSVARIPIETPARQSHTSGEPTSPSPFTPFLRRGPPALTTPSHPSSTARHARGRVVNRPEHGTADDDVLPQLDDPVTPAKPPKPGGKGSKISNSVVRNTFTHDVRSETSLTPL